MQFNHPASQLSARTQTAAPVVANGSVLEIKNIESYPKTPDGTGAYKFHCAHRDLASSSYSVSIQHTFDRFDAKSFSDPDKPSEYITRLRDNAALLASAILQTFKTQEDLAEKIRHAVASEKNKTVITMYPNGYYATTGSFTTTDSRITPDGPKYPVSLLLHGLTYHQTFEEKMELNFQGDHPLNRHLEVDAIQKHGFMTALQLIEKMLQVMMPFMRGIKLDADFDLLLRDSDVIGTWNIAMSWAGIGEC